MHNAMIELIQKSLSPSRGFSEVIVLPIQSIASKNINKLQKSDQLVCAESEDSRMLVESKRVDIIVNAELYEQKDSLHQRRAGINEVICKLAKKNCVAIGFNFSLLLHTEGKQRARLLGRMQQNAMLARKYKVPVVISCFASKIEEQRSSYELAQFGIVLGFTPQEAKEAVGNVANILAEKKGRIKPGLKVIS